MHNWYEFYIMAKIREEEIRRNCAALSRRKPREKTPRTEISAARKITSGLLAGSGRLCITAGRALQRRSELVLPRRTEFDPCGCEEGAAV